MKYFQHQNNADHLVVLFHGTGGNEYQMLPIAGQLFPQADVISFEGDYGTGMQRRYFPPLMNGVMDRKVFNEAVELFLKQWKTLDIVYKKITLIGYSNGANFIIGLIEKGIAVDEVYLLHPADLGYHLKRTEVDTSIVITAGANDYIVSPGDAKKLEKQFKEVFTEVQFLLLDGGHEISDIEISRLKELNK